MKGVYPNRFIYNHKEVQTNWRVKSEEIELDDYNGAVFGKDKNGRKGTVSFSPEKCELQILDGNCLSVGLDNLFIQFYNHDIKHNQ
jgi:hypothetical protein